MSKLLKINNFNAWRSHARATQSAWLQRLALTIGTLLFTLAACTSQTDAPPHGAASELDVPPAKQFEHRIAEEQEAKRATQAKTRDELVVTEMRQESLLSKVLLEPSLSDVPMSVVHPRMRGQISKDDMYRHSFAPPHPEPGHPWINPDPVNRENYESINSNPIQLVSKNPVSTFSIDVDTGSYANVRRMLNAGTLPRQDAVRVEELINYFSYNYAQPRNTNVPFSINTEVATTPWNPNTHLLQVGLKGYEVDERRAANLVFLLDVSGSMNSPDKLPLLKNAFRLLTQQLDAQDSISIVVYAGASGVVLEPTAGNQKSKILNALNQLSAGGSTNGAAGITLAYQMAEQAYIEGGINRVVLATDGDFNVGTVNHEALIDMIEQRRKQGIALTTLGFGTGNYNDHLMEQLADKGNGNYAYIDGLNEARKVLVEELTSTLQTIAKDVKVQIEFNPAVVSEYRLIGYENRALRREDFNNDRIDAGEIGAGHTVTALYEISLVGSEGKRIDQLRYGRSQDVERKRPNAELAFVRLRYKQPDGDTSKLIERVVQQNDVGTIANASEELKFAASVAAFGQKLRGGEYIESFSYDNIRSLAERGRADDRFGYRREFISLVDLAGSLSTPERIPVAASQ